EPPSFVAFTVLFQVWRPTAGAVRASFMSNFGAGFTAVYALRVGNFFCAKPCATKAHNSIASNSVVRFTISPPVEFREQRGRQAKGSRSPTDLRFHRQGSISRVPALHKNKERN